MTPEQVCLAFVITRSAVGAHYCDGVIVDWTGIVPYFPFTLRLGGFGVRGCVSCHDKKISWFVYLV